MAKSKYETHVRDKLVLIEGWARDGLTDEQIAKNLGISIQSFYTYKNKYTEFFEVLKKGKEVIDIQVENALLKRALGYEEEETETFIEDMGNGITKKKIKKVTKKIAPDTTAIIFWLKNRKPQNWRDKKELEHGGKIDTGTNDLSSKQLEEEISKLEKKLGINTNEQT